MSHELTLDQYLGKPFLGIAVLSDGETFFLFEDGDGEILNMKVDAVGPDGTDAALMINNRDLDEFKKTRGFMI